MGIMVGAAFAIAFLSALVLGRFFIPYMRKLKIGQSIREIGPKWHMSKQGTPIMGGLLFIAGAAAVCLTAGIQLLREGNFLFIYVLVFALGFGFIGFLDDYVKVAKKRNLGLTVIQKMLLQIAMSLAFISLLRYLGVMTPNLYIPFANIVVPLPWVWYMIIMILATCLTVNAVNFTDGVDGHLGCVTLPVMIFFLVFAYLRENIALSVFSAAMAGGIAAFLIYNFNPAKIFMGDTGSFFIGGAVCGLAFALNIPLVIPIVGLIYVIEIVTVVLQVGYFKLTKGKRIFKMTPIHHHFEMSGWSEKKICAASSAVTVIMCVLAYFATSGAYNV
jgi:phospho-N-acetylmuramoyl-pentapeptide-transferase